MSTRWVFALCLFVAVVAATSPPFEGCPPICLMLCQYGNERDANGCEICQCREPPSDSEECPPLCRMYCPYGNERNEDNCEICKCRPPPPGFEESYEFEELGL